MIATPIGHHLVSFGSRPADDIAPLPPASHFTPSFVAEPEIDLATLLDAARLEGRQEGEAAAAAAADARLAADREQTQNQIAAARQAWCAEQGDRLATLLETAVTQLRSSLAESAAAVLLPFLTSAARDRVIDELGMAVADVLRDKGAAPLRIAGPADLVAALVVRLGEQPAVEISVREDAQDVSVEIGQTLIESRLGVWAEHLRAARE
jgi:hypothetical protein